MSILDVGVQTNLPSCWNINSPARFGASVSLLPATQFILEHVERITGRPVHVQEDPSLSTLAHIHTARGNAPMHLVRYKPQGTEPPDYFVAYQCGFVIRLFQTPEEK